MWLLDRSYILCDREAPGFPIRYASSGFAELFETSPAECQGKKCGAMVGIESVRANAASLVNLAGACSLSPGDVETALDILHDSSAFEVQRMLSTGTASFVTVNQTRKGDLLVVCVFMSTLCHRASGRGYTIGMQCDFTDEATLQDVLIEALQGEVVAEERRRSFQTSCSQLLGRPDVAEFLDLTVGGSWWPSAATDLTTLGQKTMRKELAEKPHAFSARRENADPGLHLPKEAEEVDCLQKLASAGHAAGPVIARGRRSRSTRVVRSLQGSREFAVKVADACEGVHALERLRDEYKILRGLAHPNIVRVADFLAARGSCAMVMDYIPGRALAQAVGALRRDESYHIARKVLGALAYLHDDHQVSHRDLKMDNIMVGAEALDQEAGLVKIIDFRNARQDAHERLQGSVLDFLSSKQSLSTALQDNIGDVDVRILPPHPGERDCDFNLDVFAFGLVFAGLLVQREVFAGDVFDGDRLSAPLPEVDRAVRQYVTFVLTPGLMPRRKTRVALHDLPPPHTWSTN